MIGELEADDDGVAVMFVLNVFDGDYRKLCVRFSRGAVNKVLVTELFHALPPSAAQLDH